MAAGIHHFGTPLTAARRAADRDCGRPPSCGRLGLRGIPEGLVLKKSMCHHRFRVVDRAADIGDVRTSEASSRSEVLLHLQQAPVRANVRPDHAPRRKSNQGWK